MNLDTMIREADPVGRRPAARVGDAQAEAIFAKVSSARASRTSPRKHALRLASATTGVAATVIVATLFSTGEFQSAPSGAAQVLREAAQKLVAQPTLPVLGQGQYYFESDTTVGSCPMGIDTPADPGGVEIWYSGSYTTNTWTAVDGSGVVTTTPLPGGHWATPTDQALWNAGGSPTIAGACFSPSTTTRPASGSTSTGPGMSDLPKDPSVLGALIAAGRVSQTGLIEDNGYGTSVDAQFNLVDNLLGTASLAQRQELVAVLYNVLAQLPGVEVTGNVVDALGRTGVGIIAPGTSEISSEEYVINPNNGQLLDQEFIPTAMSSSELSRSGYSVGEPAWSTSFGAIQVANGVDQRP